MDKKEIFKQFLDKSEVLIVDKNPSSRNRLLKTMYDMGSKRHMIHTAGTLVEAQEIIATKEVRVILSDYYIGGGSGFDLFKMVREKYPDSKEPILILVTSNISQTAVAKAAEEDVDSFIIKPYTVQSIQENLTTTILNKINPSIYILKIEEGKKLIKEGKLDEAISLLSEACNLHPKPALALFYMGQAEYMKQLIGEATGSYNKGLTFNNIHYKCLVGLFELFMREGKHVEAYQIVKKIAKYFPANPDRLAQIIRLAVQTGNFEDMQMYYEIFISLDERVQILTNYIGAGMYVSGKHYLKKKDKKVAMTYFDNIAVSCSEFTKFLRGAITALVENDMAIDAEKYLGRFDPGTRENDDFLISDFLVSSKLSENKGEILKQGLSLYNKRIRDFDFMQALIDVMSKAGYKDEKIKPYLDELISLYPDKVTNVSA